MAKKKAPTEADARSDCRKASPIALVSGTVQAPKSPIGWMENIGDSTAAEEKQHRNYQKPSHLTDSKYPTGM